MRRVLVLCSVLVGCAVLPATAAAQVPSITVTPSSGLAHPGQLVQVRIEALPSGDYEIVQTARGPGFAYCNGMAALFGWAGGFPYSQQLFVRTPLTPGLGSTACQNSGMPAEVPCLTDSDAGLQCLVEVRRPDGTVLAAAPIEFLSPANRPPVAVGDAWTVMAGDTLTVPPPGVLGNDSDPDGDAITARVLEISFASSEWTGLRPDGSFGYTAGPGTRQTLHKTITYVAVDSHGAESAPAQAVVLVQPRGNRPPVANCDTYFIKPGGTLKIAPRGVLTNDFDADGDPMAANLTLTSFPRSRIKFTPSGGFTFKPAGTRLIASLRYRAVDTTGAASEEATVYIGIGLRPKGLCERPPENREPHVPANIFRVEVRMIRAQYGTGANNAKVKSSPAGVTCRRSKCVGNFYKGTHVKLVALSKRLWAFDSWSGNCAKHGSNRTCRLRMSQNHFVDAKFFFSGSDFPAPPAPVYFVSTDRRRRVPLGEAAEAMCRIACWEFFSRDRTAELAEHGKLPPIKRPPSVWKPVCTAADLLLDLKGGNSPGSGQPGPCEVFVSYAQGFDSWRNLRRVKDAAEDFGCVAIHLEYRKMDGAVQTVIPDDVGSLDKRFNVHCL